MEGYFNSLIVDSHFPFTVDGFFGQNDIGSMRYPILDPNAF